MRIIYLVSSEEEKEKLQEGLEAGCECPFFIPECLELGTTLSCSDCVDKRISIIVDKS